MVKAFGPSKLREVNDAHVLQHCGKLEEATQTLQQQIRELNSYVKAKLCHSNVHVMLKRYR